MKDKIVRICIIVLVLIGILFTLRFVIGGSEDDWICVDGQWIKHGYPSAPIPETDCIAD